MLTYLDHAATSFPKPPEVLAAIQHWFTEVGVSPARGDGALCRAASAISNRTRTALARLCGVRKERLLFTSGATEAANLFLRGFLRDGDTVVASAAEHSAVARPLRGLQAEGRIQLHVVPVDEFGYMRRDRLHAALERHAPRLLAVNHASNVTGAVQDIASAGALARSHACTILVDASQSAGVLPLHDLPADVLFASAHKSLLGPPGLGFLALRDGVPLRPVKLGGTGSASAQDSPPEVWPGSFEAGTPNMPSIAGLGAALAWIEARGMAHLHRQGLEQIDSLRASLTQELGAGVRLLGPESGPRIAVLSFTLRDLDPAEAGTMLDAAGVHVRTGFHCAPWIHGCIGTEAGGTIRVSPGPFVSAADIQRVVRALAP